MVSKVNPCFIPSNTYHINKIKLIKHEKKAIIIFGLFISVMIPVDNLLIISISIRLIKRGKNKNEICNKMKYSTVKIINVDVVLKLK